MKRVFLIGFLVVILLAIPLTLYILSQQTQPKIGATANTNLTFLTPTTPPVVGQTFPVDIQINPGGTNQISLVKMTIVWDKTVLQEVSFKPQNAKDTGYPLFPLDGPTDPAANCPSTQCSLSVTLSIGNDPTKAIVGSSNTTIATITFTALAPTAQTSGGAPTLQFGGDTNALSLATGSNGDLATENVLQKPGPANLTIVAVPTGTITPTQVPGTNPTDTPTVPPSGGGGNPSPTTGGGTNQGPTCTSFALNPTSGTAPVDIQLTAVGNVTGATISKATFNFGDGSVQDITSGGGIGTTSVSVQTTHTYKTNGTFTASAVFTDSNGNLTTPSSCSTSVTLGGGPTPTGTPIAGATVSPTPQSIPATGPGSTIVAVGLAGFAIAVMGVALIAGL